MLCEFLVSCKLRVKPQALRIHKYAVRYSHNRRSRVFVHPIASSSDKWQRKHDFQHIKMQEKKDKNSKKKHGPSPVLPPYKFGSYPSLKLPDEHRRESIARLVSKINDFQQLKLLPEIRDAVIKEIKENTVLRSQNYMNAHTKVKTEGELNGLIIRPTPIQTAAIKIINQKREPGEFLKVYTLAAETGTGKTWSYLAPLLQYLREQDIAHGTDDYVDINGENENQDLDIAVKAAKGEFSGVSKSTFPENDKKIFDRPRKAGIRSLILVPTHELVDQVYSTIQHTSNTLGTSCFKWDLDSNFKVFMDAFRKGIDVFVSTPPKLLSLTKYDSVKHPKALLGSVGFSVVDEADTLMDGSFIQDTYGILRNLPNLNTLVFASATIPAEFNRVVHKLFSDVVSITTPALHKLPKAIEFRVINAALDPYKGSKMKALAQTLYSIHCDGSEKGFEKRVIVFVNNKDDCAKVATRLREKYSDDAVYISGNDTPEERKLKVKTFIDPPSRLEDSKRPVLKVLVCTDLLSRGLNFTGIRNVVLLDVPHNSADLVHRSGRTGRMNQSGRVFLIINNKDKSHVKGLPKVLRNNRRLG